jgi:ATP-binding cassette, subfamily B (MDR/TAP), member 1
MDEPGDEGIRATKDLEKETEQKEETKQHTEAYEVVREKELEKNTSDSSSNEGPAEDVKKIDSRIIQVKDVKKDDELYAHLPEHEREIIKRQLDIPSITVTFKTLYRYATRNDLIIIFVSALCAIIGGAAMPLMTVIFGSLAGTFQGFINGTEDPSSFTSSLSYYTLFFVYLAIGEFVTIYICTLGFIYTGEHITAKIREEYLTAILRQNIGFFDKLGAGEITTRITADTNLVQEGISEKVGLTLTALATFITAFIIGFVKYWKLTLILTSTIFAIATVMGGGSTFIVKYNKKSLESYATGGTVAEEVISSIRNAIAFGTQDKLARQYEVHLREAAGWGLKVKIALGCMVGGMFWILYLNYGLSFWYVIPS